MKATNYDRDDATLMEVLESTSAFESQRCTARRNGRGKEYQEISERCYIQTNQLEVNLNEKEMDKLENERERERGKETLKLEDVEVVRSIPVLRKILFSEIPGVVVEYTFLKLAAFRFSSPGSVTPFTDCYFIPVI